MVIVIHIYNSVMTGQVRSQCHVKIMNAKKYVNAINYSKGAVHISKRVNVNTPELAKRLLHIC